MKTGFTLGKFAPFHKGHEFLISTALQEMNHVIVVIYNASNVTDIPTGVRASWIKQIFPSVEIIIAEDGPQETGYTIEIINRQNQYLQKLLKSKSIDVFYSSEKYGEHVSNFLNCRNRIVDINRERFSISATQIRQRKYAKEMLSEMVYNSIKPRIYFLGGPSTGKSTISLLCAQNLNAAYCKEYGRDYWFEHQQNHRLSMNDLEIIAKQQTILEDQISCGDEDYVSIDTTTITTLAYAYYYFGYASDTLKNLVKENLYKYKNIFLCADDIPFDDSWDRSGPASRTEIQTINKEILKELKLPHQELKGNIQQRYNTVIKQLGEYKLCGVY